MKISEPDNISGSDTLAKPFGIRLIYYIWRKKAFIQRL